METSPHHFVTTNEPRTRRGFTTPSENRAKAIGRGFTLIELLVVIAIIGVLSSVVLASLNSARAKGRNAATLQTLQQYRTAANYYYDKYGKYPNVTADSTGGWNCLGSYSDSKCWKNDATGYTSDSGLDGAFKEFYPGLPAGGTVGGVEGYIYSCTSKTNGVCSAYRILWYLEGSGVSCGMGTMGTLSQPAGYTYCEYRG